MKRWYLILATVVVLPSSLVSAGPAKPYEAYDGSSGAVYSKDHQPFIVNTLQEQKVTASDGAPKDWFGTAVIVSGTKALISAPTAAVNGNVQQGAVYFFSLINGVWTQVQKFTASDGAAGDQFGSRIALSGNTAIITSRYATVNNHIWQGAAYVFQLSGNTWTQTQKLTASDGVALGTFGGAVAIADGYALIGAGGAATGGVTVLGSVYSFNLSQGTWVQTQRILAPDQNDTTAHFGESIAISGNSALIGAYASTVNGHLGQGAVYNYNRFGGIWTLGNQLTASDGAARDNFGVSVAIQGTSALIGAPGAAINGNISQGAVYFFAGAGSYWNEIQKLAATDGTAINLFGASVNLVGSSALVGAYAVNSNRGAAYLFGQNTLGVWSQKDELMASDGQSSNVFGYFTALDSCTALVSAWNAAVAGNAGQGAAYFYARQCIGQGGNSP